MKKYNQLKMILLLDDLEIPEHLLNIINQEKDVYGQHYYRFFYHLALEAQPKLIVELGTYRGFGCRSFKEGCPEARVITMDLQHNPELPHRLDTIEYWQCSSLAPKEELKDIDILFIDTEHDGLTCEAEFGVYHDKLAQNAIVFFDDIYLNEEMEDFWKEFNPSGYDKFDLPLHGKAGFGVLIKQ